MEQFALYLAVCGVLVFGAIIVLVYRIEQRKRRDSEIIHITLQQEVRVEAALQKGEMGWMRAGKAVSMRNLQKRIEVYSAEGQLDDPSATYQSWANSDSMLGWPNSHEWNLPTCAELAGAGRFRHVQQFVSEAEKNFIIALDGQITRSR